MSHRHKKAPVQGENRGNRWSGLGGSGPKDHPAQGGGRESATFLWCTH
ncbi:hypothetical protein Nhal_3398 [Nitrosococcus halophilus Nc 4]|uniref:Uncharacterized protein n=1 Tax=Nitrosococcus halophilus (strain Nc4) TaxID=472759 RepID=D5C0V7_NITHN|nr:hypothetical protein Nhal_3398 [Nitrosococcus halophilus Nc 4]